MTPSKSTWAYWHAGLVALALLGFVLWPVHQNFRAQPEDGFPGSYFPMFSQAHPEVQTFTYLLGIDEAGRRHYLHNRYAGSGGMNQIRRQIGRIAGQGRGAAMALCRSVARRVAKDNADPASRLRSVSLVTGEFRPTDYFRGKSRAPISEKVHATFKVQEAPKATFAQWVHGRVTQQSWLTRSNTVQIAEAATLETSLRLSRRYLVQSQRESGNFRYSYDFVRGTPSTDDNAIRQAGALWGVAVMHREAPGADTEVALRRGLDFFLDRMCAGAGPGGVALAYPGERACASGTVALTALTLVEALRAERAGSFPVATDRRVRMEKALDGMLRHLEALKRPDGRFSESWMIGRRKASPAASPYADGEILLAMTMAARHLGHLGFDRWRPLVEKTAPALAKFYTADQWAKDPDSDLTKGFFQWGIMAFWEYREAGWPGKAVLDDTTLALAHWMIHEHRVFDRVRNTAYAVEGLVPAYRVAVDRGHTRAASTIRATILETLTRLTSWQVGGPLSHRNPFLVAHAKASEQAAGGILNTRDHGELRIDVTQHQTHAVAMTLRHVLADPPDAPSRARHPATRTASR